MMSDPSRVVLFDFGNVLIHWNLHKIYDEHFPTPGDVNAFLEEVHFFEWNSLMDRGLPFAEGVDRASAQFPKYADLFRLFDMKWLETIREPIEGSIAIAERLKDAGYPLYILSNISAEKFPQARLAHPFLSLFDDILLSSELGAIKPEPAIFLRALERINRPAEKIVFIDDAPANIESGRRLGMACIHFQSPEQLEMELKALKVL